MTTDDREREVWIDKHGDVWTLGDDGLMHTPETRPFPREHVERKWGPLRPARTFDDPPRTVPDLLAALQASIQRAREDR